MKRLILCLTALLLCITVGAQSLEDIRGKAKAGDANSQYLMGFYYANGLNGLKRDYGEALKWLGMGSTSGSADAAELLGTLYYYGIGVGQSYEKAITFYEKARGNGSKDVSLLHNRIADCKEELSMPYDHNKLRDIIVSKGMGENSSGGKVLHDNFDPSMPPILEIVPNSFKFIDPNGNNAIDAGENCSITFKVKNSGKGTAYHCVAHTQSAELVKGLQLESVNLPDLAVGEVKTVSLPIKADMSIIDGTADLIVQVNEPHGLGTDPIQLKVATKQYVAPELQIVDYAITSNNGSTLKRKVPFDLQVLLQNLKHGTAEDINVDFSAPNGVIVMNSDREKEYFKNIAGGATKSIVYQLIVTDNFKGNSIPIDIHLKEKYGKYAKDRHIDLQLNQSMAANKIEVKEKESEEKSFDIQVATLRSDVDNIPSVTTVKAEQTFAVVIANESYNKESGVPFAANDGKIFAEYCKNVLGLPEENVHLSVNATLNDMKHEIGWLSNVLETRKGKAKAIFYYAGHGVPDDASKNAYLLPVDGYGSDITTGYPLEQLYKDLGSVPSEEVTVFLDACFSGAKREGGMLASARGIALKANRGEPSGNMVVFSAAQGDETAYPYKKEGHGLFTYYLLRELKDTKGNVTLKQLGDYITEKVSQQSIVINSKPQTPMVIPSKTVSSSWENWKLK